MNDLISAKEVTNSLGISLRRLTYFQSLGLISNSEDIGGYRLYSEGDVEKIRQVDNGIKKYRSKKLIERKA